MAKEQRQRWPQNLAKSCELVVADNSRDGFCLRRADSPLLWLWEKRKDKPDWPKSLHKHTQVIWFALTSTLDFIAPLALTIVLYKPSTSSPINLFLPVGLESWVSKLIRKYWSMTKWWTVVNCNPCPFHDLKMETEQPRKGGEIGYKLPHHFYPAADVKNYSLSVNLSLSLDVRYYACWQALKKVQWE